MRKGRVTLSIGEVKVEEFNVDAVINNLAVKISKGFSNEIGPHLVAAAQARTPVSKERNFNPKTSSFKPLRVKPPGSFGTETSVGSARASRLFDLRNMDYRERAKEVKTINEAQFFEGTGKNKGKTPDLIEVQRGTVKGAFRHQPGTLRDSIKFDGVRREGDKVIGTVRAHAPYAIYRHEGFTHKGGRNRSGKTTEIAPKRFLREGLLNVRGRLRNRSTYEG